MFPLTLLPIYENYIMWTQGNRNSQSATSIFFDCKTNDKNISKPEGKREDPDGQVLVVNTGTLSSLSQKTLQIPAYGFGCKEK